MKSMATYMGTMKAYAKRIAKASVLGGDAGWERWRSEVSLVEVYGVTERRASCDLDRWSKRYRTAISC